MKLPSLNSITPTTRIAIIVVLVGGALFLLLPLIVGVGTPGGSGYPIAKTDHISSWTWKGVYEDGAEKQDETEKAISQLKSMLGKNKQGSASDYDLYAGIGTEYELLGDGKSAYQYLSKAITLDPKRGLAYLNMGHLMEELGAFSTAHTAYDAAVAAEPTSAVYQTAQQDFLVHHPGQ